MDGPNHRFAIAISINGVACDITLNDVPIIRSYKASRVDTMMPVTEFMVSGHNTLCIRSLVDLSEVGMSATRASATLMVSPLEITAWEPLFKVETNADPSSGGRQSAEAEQTRLGLALPQVDLFEPDILLLNTSRSIDLLARMPEWIWTTSPIISRDDTTIQSVAAWLQNFVAMIDQNDTAGISTLQSEKTKELALAYGIDPLTAAEQIGLEAAVRNPSLTRLPVAWDRIDLEVLGHGHLVRPYDTRHGAPVVFVEDGPIYTSFEILLRQHGSGWMISR